MTLLVQSFLLSFKTFWRYLIVMPFVLIPSFLVLMTLLLTPLLITRGFVLVLFLVAPILFSILFAFIFAFLIISISSFNIMIGCRAAFGAMGVHNDLDFGRLVGKSFAFTFAQLAASVFMALILGGIVAATFLMSDAGTQFLSNPAANVAFLVNFMLGHPVAIGVGILSILLSLGLSALLAVPMAGAAISATPKMGPTDAFIGIGKAFLPILILLIVIAVVTSMTGVYSHISMLAGALASAATQYLTSQPMIWPAQTEVALGVVMFLFVVWTSCWFYAAAALGWRNYTDDRDEALAYKRHVERFEPEDLRALREKRDQERAALI